MRHSPCLVKPCFPKIGHPPLSDVPHIEIAPLLFSLSTFHFSLSSPAAYAFANDSLHSKGAPMNVPLLDLKPSKRGTPEIDGHLCGERVYVVKTDRTSSRQVNALFWDIQSDECGVRLFRRKGWAAVLIQLLLFALFASVVCALFFVLLPMASSHLSLSDWPAWMIFLVLTAGAIFFLVQLGRGIPPAMIRSVEFCTTAHNVKVKYIGGICRRIDEWPCAIQITHCVGQGGRAVWASINFKSASVVIPLLAVGGFDTPRKGEQYASGVLRPISELLSVKIC